MYNAQQTNNPQAAQEQKKDPQSVPPVQNQKSQNKRGRNSTRGVDRNPGRGGNSQNIPSNGTHQSMPSQKNPKTPQNAQAATSDAGQIDQQPKATNAPNKRQAKGNNPKPVKDSPPKDDVADGVTSKVGGSAEKPQVGRRQTKKNTKNNKDTSKDIAVPPSNSSMITSPNMQGIQDENSKDLNNEDKNNHVVVIPPPANKKKPTEVRNQGKNKANLSQNSDKLAKTPSKLTRDQKKKSTVDFDAPDPIEPSGDNNDFHDPSVGSQSNVPAEGQAD